MCAGKHTPPYFLTQSGTESMLKKLAVVSRSSSLSVTASSLFMTNWSPKICGLFLTFGMFSRIYAPKPSAPSTVLNRQTTWISSLVQSSIPGTTVMPAFLPASAAARQFFVLLWSVRAIMSKPNTFAIFTRL